MQIKVHQQDNSKIAIVKSNDILISNAQEALDLIATIHYNNNCQKMIINKSNIIEDFFNLSTNIAGDILQKYINYGFKVAIIGDFSTYKSKSLNDFIYESNNGKDLFFLNNEIEAISKLHNL